MRSVREAENYEMSGDSQMKSWGAMPGKGNSISGKLQWGSIPVPCGIKSTFGGNVLRWSWWGQW